MTDDERAMLTTFWEERIPFNAFLGMKVTREQRDCETTLYLFFLFFVYSFSCMRHEGIKRDQFTVRVEQNTSKYFVLFYVPFVRRAYIKRLLCYVRSPLRRKQVFHPLHFFDKCACRRRRRTTT